MTLFTNFLLELFASSLVQLGHGVTLFILLLQRRSVLKLTTGVESAATFNPTRVSRISWQPRVFSYKKFLTDEECEHLINLAKVGSLEKSMVVNDETGEGEASDVRTSSGMFLDTAHDEVVASIERRIAAWTFLPTGSMAYENGEQMQILHYEHGQKYEPHADFFVDDFNVRAGGNRVATVLMYLSNVDKGGETIFPASEVADEDVDDDDYVASDIHCRPNEVVPSISTKSLRTVIGVEDLTESQKWNLLIGQALNDQTGFSSNTLKLKPMDSRNYEQEVSTTCGASTPLTGQQNTQYIYRDQGNRYMLIASKKMVGVFVSVWIKTKVVESYDISVRVSSVACGIMGYLGNKGSVSVSMTIEGTTFCFTAAHLASGEKNGDEGRRNHQVSEIFRRTTFTRLAHKVNEHHPLTILGHDCLTQLDELKQLLMPAGVTEFYGMAKG
uniref:Prolyl 4-hydroxylase alpha subunit domain-containing protein n=1 Tax=Daucus carota subsp. sativus TaxID=79200 RepID=A0A162AC46_DAUCS